MAAVELAGKRVGEPVGEARFPHVLKQTNEAVGLELCRSPAFLGRCGRRVADGVQIKVDVNGTDVFGDGAGSAFAELDALSVALRAGDQAGISNAITLLNTRLDTVTAAPTAAASCSISEMISLGLGRDTP